MKSLNNGVFYIGADDYKSSLFESQYILPEGMAYNSYLIVDEQVAILDTADSNVSNEWYDNLNEALDGREPNYLVVHHLEPDHSALIKTVMDKWPCLKVVASSKAIAMLPQFFEDIDLEGRTVEVKEGDVLDLGSHKLRFIAAPMVHWPEVMMSFDESDNVLYSADAFGKFGGLERCGFYGSQDEDWSCEARRYYFNIVGKYGCQVSSLLGKVMRFPVLPAPWTAATPPTAPGDISARSLTTVCPMTPCSPSWGTGSVTAVISTPKSLSVPGSLPSLPIMT